MPLIGILRLCLQFELHSFVVDSSDGNETERIPQNRLYIANWIENKSFELHSIVKELTSARVIFIQLLLFISDYNTPHIMMTV